MKTRRTLLAALAYLACVTSLSQAQTTDWPKRQPIRLVAVFPPGGSVDQVARILAPQLSQQLGQTIVAARAKKNVSYGTIGSGSLGHLAMAMALLGKNGSLPMTHVPYKGGGPLMQDAVAGHVPLSIGSVFVTKPHIDSKRMRPLAVTTSKRSSELPDVPTVAESGYPGFGAPAWWALLAPARIFIDRQIDICEKVVKENNIKAE
jgi:tripartite-type tricarboxylate transporter receptor subunit TctC